MTSQHEDARERVVSMQPAARLLVVTPIMAPYRVPAFNELAAVPGITLHVVYLAERDPSRSWDVLRDEMSYSSAVLREVGSFQLNGGWAHLSLGLFREVRRFRPDVVVAGGWDQPLHHLLLWARPLWRYRFVPWVESNARDARGGRRVVELVKRRFVQLSDAFLVPGTASAEYVAALGADRSRVHVAPNCIDNDFFTRFGSCDRRQRRLPPRLLFVGRLEAGKGVDVLLEAWRGSPRDGRTLALAGEGSLRRDIERAAKDFGGSVELLGHLDRAQLAAAYREADVFVFPSRSDPWGLVINEAMAAGLPVITTDAPGAARDLVYDGINGYVVRAGDVEGLRVAMDKLCEVADLRAQMGQRSLARIADFSPRVWATAVADATRAACADPAPRS